VVELDMARRYRDLAERGRNAAIEIVRDMGALMARCHGCSEDDDVIQAVLARASSFVNGYGGMS
jgi:hypothetical protein